MKTYTLILLLIALVSTPLRAQSDTLSLEGCVAYALAHSPRISSGRADQKAAQSDYLEAIGRLLPSVSASTSAHLNMGRGIDPQTNTYTDINTFRNSYSIESSLLLFDGLSSIFALRRQRLEKAIAHQNLRMTLTQVRLETIEAYYHLLFAQETYHQALSHYDNSSEIVRRTQRMYELGMKSLPDLYEAQATQAADEAALVRRQNERDIALLKLKAKMHYPIEAPLHIEDTLTFETPIPSPLSGDALYTAALSSLPQALIATQKVQSAQAQYKSSIGSFFPHIHLFAGWGTSFSFATVEKDYPPYWDQLKSRRGEYVGVSVSFDIFDRFKKISALQRAKAQTMTAQAQQAEVHSEIYHDILQSIAEVNSAVLEYTATERKAHHLNQAYQAILRNYETGHASSIDLSTAAARLKEAMVSKAHSYTTYLLKRQWLEYYTDPCGTEPRVQ